MKAIIALEDGTIIPARSFTGAGEALGEMVFNTSMSGYQEILSDPSSAGQLVTMTYPLIGNCSLKILLAVAMSNLSLVILFQGTLVIQSI